MERKRKKHCLVAIIVCTVILLWIKREYFRNEKVPRRPIILPEFRHIKWVNGLHTFYNVCIEALVTPKYQNYDGHIFNETKRIVVYGDRSYPDQASINFSAIRSWNSPHNIWELHFKRENISRPLETFENTAFFIHPTCPGNFHHFFVDEFMSLYSIIQLCNRLHPGAKNRIVYRTPLRGELGNRCFCRRKYENILKTLYINEVHDVFYNLPENTCFKQAVFGMATVLSRPRDIIDHVLRFHNIPLPSDSRDVTEPFVTILARKDRRIINTDDVESFAKEAGFRNVRTIDFDDISDIDQVRIMSTTRVFIGVQGAGLQWAVFMPERTCLIELAWPQKHWDFFYNRYLAGFDIAWQGVAVQEVRVNWTSYERNVRSGVQVIEEEKQFLLKHPPTNSVDNIWKWADIFVHREDIFEALKKTYIGINYFNPSG